MAPPAHARVTEDHRSDDDDGAFFDPEMGEVEGRKMVCWIHVFKEVMSASFGAIQSIDGTLLLSPLSLLVDDG
jgi:hypothetical protein